MGIVENKDGKSVVLFAGTTEGRLLAGYLASVGCRTVVCVATEYGQDILEECMGKGSWIGVGAAETDDAKQDTAEGAGMQAPDIRQGRLDQAGMEKLLDEVKPGIVIDATHPYAVEVTRNIKCACEMYPWIRLLRCQRDSGTEECLNNHPDHLNTGQLEGTIQADQGNGAIIHVPDIQTAVSWLNHRPGNILVTTGSKELEAFCELEDYRQRVYARVLPSVESVQICRNLGYEGRHIIALQGPFSREMNMAMIKEYHCSYLVTKDGGRAGGLNEKLEAALKAGIVTVLIDRPYSGKGISLEEVKKQIEEWMDHER